MHSALTFRRAGLADLPSLTALERELFGGSSYPYSVLRQIMDTWGSGLHVAERDGSLMGYSLVVPSEEPLTGWMWSMGVDPACHRQGIGKRLLAYTLDRVRNANVKRLLLTVDPANAAAIALYIAFDFRITERAADYLGPGEDRLVMECVL